MTELEHVGIMKNYYFRKALIKNNFKLNRNFFERFHRKCRRYSQIPWHLFDLSCGRESQRYFET